MTEVYDLVARYMGDASGYLRTVEQVSSATTSTVRMVEAAGQRVENVTGSLLNFGNAVTRTLAQAGVSLGSAGLGAGAIKAAAEFENMQLNFEVMLRSAERGRDLTRQLMDLAARTPLTLPDVQQAAKTLLQFGYEGEEVIPMIRMLGDVALGDANKLQHLAYVMGEVKSMGALMGHQLRMLATTGFNPIKTIAQLRGVDEQQLARQVHSGHANITPQELMNAFRMATGEGGQFFNMMERQSQTTIGLFSTMRDNVGMSVRKIGTALIEDLHINEAIRTVSRLAAQFDALFSSLDKDTRRTVIQTAAWVTGLIMLLPIITAARLIFSSLFGGLLISLPMTILYQTALLTLWVTGKVLALGFGLAVAAFNIQFIVYRAILASGILMTVAWASTVGLAKLGMLAYYGILLAVGAAQLAWNIAGGGSVAAMLAMSALIGVYSVGVLLAKGVTWLWNAALVALDALLAPALIIPFVAALLALAGTAGAAVFVLTLVGSAGYAAFTTAGELFSILRDTEGVFAPLSRIGEMFGRWWALLKDVLSLAQTDGPMAWALFKASANLAINEVRDLFPPLWEWIKGFAGATWDFVGDMFTAKMGKAIAEVIDTFARNSTIFGTVMDLTGATNSIANLRRESDTLARAARQGFSLDAQRLNRNFQVQESAATGAARAELQWMQWLAQWTTNPTGINAAEEAGDKLGDAATRGLGKALHKFDNVLSGSSEAIRRIADYADKMAEKIQGNRPPRTPPGMGRGGGALGWWADLRQMLRWSATGQGGWDNNAPAPTPGRNWWQDMRDLAGAPAAGGGAEDPALAILRQIRDAIQNATGIQIQVEGM